MVKSVSPHFFSPSRLCRRQSSHFSVCGQKRCRTTTVSGRERKNQRTHQKRVIFIGQAPGPRCDPDASSALAGGAEKRIARLSGLPLQELWKRCDRRNILREYPGRRNGSHGNGIGIVFDSTGTNELTRYRIHPSVHYSTGDEFPLAEAQAAAAALEGSGALRPYKLAVLLGLGVARAFGIEHPKFFKLLSPSGAKGMTKVLIFPHPSGVSHFWNSAENRTMASNVIRAALRSALGPVRYDAAACNAAPAGSGSAYSTAVHDAAAAASSPTKPRGRCKDRTRRAVQF